jgi:biotin-[acetyl-CoA-carboxylase] ligase BirA-like protein
MGSAPHQKAGRGRNGKVWHGDEHKNIYCSFGVKHQHPPTTDTLHLYMAIGAIAVLDIVRRIAPEIKTRLKYPNDVQVCVEEQWCKIAGILVEHEFLGSVCISTVIGVGINVEQTDFPDTINQPCTSFQKLGCATDVASVLEHLQHAMTTALLLTPTELSSRWIKELKPHTTRFRILGEKGVWYMSGLMRDGRLLVQHISTHTERIISDGDTLRYED